MPDPLAGSGLGGLRNYENVLEMCLIQLEARTLSQLFGRKK